VVRNKLNTEAMSVAAAPVVVETVVTVVTAPPVVATTVPFVEPVVAAAPLVVAAAVPFADAPVVTTADGVVTTPPVVGTVTAWQQAIASIVAWGKFSQARPVVVSRTRVHASTSEQQNKSTLFPVHPSLATKAPAAQFPSHLAVAAQTASLPYVLTVL